MQINFGYSHPIKTYWRKGLLPSVQYGLYGGKLTQDNISIEHLIPKSQKGHTFFDNIALATKRNNNIRGSKPLKDFLSKEQVESYLDQFRGIKLPDFDGFKYIEAVKNTLRNLGIIL